MNRSRTEGLVQIVVGLYDFMKSRRREDENGMVQELRRECIKVK